jgi:hypothetical protein
MGKGCGDGCPFALLAAPLAAAPAQAWQQSATPEEAGFSSTLLDRTRRIADSLRSGAAFVVYKGHVLVAWGDVGRKLQLHSVRKSLQCHGRHCRR